MFHLLLLSSYKLLSYNRTKKPCLKLLLLDLRYYSKKGSKALDSRTNPKKIRIAASVPNNFVGVIRSIFSGSREQKISNLVKKIG